MNEIQGQEDLLGDIRSELEQEPATTGQRFANYIVDLVMFYIILVALFILIALGSPRFAGHIAGWEDGISITERVTLLAVYGAYMGVLEGLLKGRTFSKFLTRTKAIEQDGATLSFSRAMLRGLSRIVPFEAFSAFGGFPWHDKWTNTRVVKIPRT